jgi:hypothetical protein
MEQLPPTPPPAPAAPSVTIETPSITASRLSSARSFYLHYVAPEPASGPFPRTVCDQTAIHFARGSQVRFQSFRNWGNGGAYTLSDDGKSIRFHGVSWTSSSEPASEEALQQCLEAEELVKRISETEGWLSICWKGANALELKDEEGNQFGFATHDTRHD